MLRFSRRTFGLFAGAGAIVTVSGCASQSEASGPAAAAFDPTPYVNPELRKFVPSLLTRTERPLNADTLEAMRKETLSYEPSEQPVWSEQIIPGPHGAPDLRVYVINRQPGSPRPAILDIHGGGFVLGNAHSSIHSLQELASALDCLIVSVDYRLAPETRFPGPLEDNYAALKWLYTNAAQLGVDRSRIAVMGESAGGGYAAMLAIAARDRGEIPLAYQALIYPMLDDRTGSVRKTPPYQGALIWTAAKNRFGWSALLGVPAGSDHVPYGAVPARVRDLHGLPPAYIAVGSIDLFVDEDIQYAGRLADAGIPVTLEVVPGGFHGFDGLPGTTLGKQFKTSLINALAAALKTTG